MPMMPLYRASGDAQFSGESHDHLGYESLKESQVKAQMKGLMTYL
jgi:hypothetical protein